MSEQSCHVCSELWRRSFAALADTHDDTIDIEQGLMRREESVLLDVARDRMREWFAHRIAAHPDAGGGRKAGHESRCDGPGIRDGCGGDDSRPLF